jgi:hypothetical protein
LPEKSGFLKITPAKAQSATAFLKDFFAPWRLCGTPIDFASLEANHEGQPNTQIGVYVNGD